MHQPGLYGLKTRLHGFNQYLQEVLMANAKPTKRTNGSVTNKVKELERILEAIAAPMFVTDQNLMIRRINDAALRIAGYNRAEVVGKMTCADLTRTPLCGTADCTIKKCMSSGESIQGETVMKTRNGKDVPVTAVCSAMFDDTGKPIGGMEVITDRTAAVEAQEETERILAAVGAPMFVTDKNLLITTINDAALKACGYRRDEVVGKMTCADFARTPLCNTDKCTIRNCMKTGEVIMGETVMHTRDGKEVPVQAACSALFDKDGQPYGGMEIIIDRTDAVESAYRMENILRSIGAPMFVTNKDLVIESINDAALRALGYTHEEVVGKMTCADVCKTPLCNTTNCTIKNCMRTREVITGETVAESRTGQKIPVAAVCSALFDKNGEPYGGMEIIVDQTEQKETLAEVARLIEAANKGELEERTDANKAQGDYRKLREGINNLLDAIVAPINEAADVLEAASNKVLNRRVQGDYAGKFAELKKNINEAINNLDEALLQVTDATEQVSSASQQIASGSQTLSQGANEQASSLEEVSSSLEEMASQTKQNAENSGQARNLADDANKNAGIGGDSMVKMLGAMNKIKDSSNATSKIVKTIDEIAMQTNLLALNAAVEAARAGEAGRGFAVVAEEVRNLAQRSAEAAKNTADMIQESVANAENGARISEEVAKALEAIQDGSKKVNDLIAEIAASSDEQSKGIEQVNTAVAQLDKVTQQNAANSEESASAAEELSSQAEELQSMIAQFQLSYNGNERKKKVSVMQRTNRSTAQYSPHPAHNGGNGNGRHSVKGALTRDAEEIIPMGDDVLQEF